MAFGEWVHETKRTYIGNATSTRDFRVQLRGGRAVLLFGVYLFLLIGIALTVYANSTGGTSVSIVEAQQSLNGFYVTVMALLGGMVSIVTPALSATSIVQERLRQSLDLVFSAPVTPKYYLVGKMLSSYRYTWMLLVLSLPITAACVVLGGASWTDVIYAYVLLSFHGVLYSAVALTVSAYAQKATGSVVLSYSLIFILSSIQIILSMSLIARGFIGSATNEQPFFTAFSPFVVSQSALTYTVVQGVNVPNVVFVGIVTILITRFCLLASGAMLRPYGGAEVRALRINGALYILALSGLFGYYVVGISSVGPTLASMDRNIFWGRTVAYATMLLGFMTPNLSAFGYEVDRRLWHDGVFNVRNIFRGTPSGNWPYLLLLLLLTAVGVLLGQYLNPSSAFVPGVPILGYVVLATGVWSFFWAVGRYASSITLLARTARSTVAVMMLLFLVLPPLLLSSAFPDLFEQSSMNVWDLYILRPLTGSDPGRPTQALVYGVGLFILALIILRISEARFRRTLSKGFNPYVAIAKTQSI